MMVRALAATGQLGTGFKEESLRAALAMRPDFIGCDAGSTDPGPYYLGAGVCMASRVAIRRDLRLLLRAAIDAGIPLLIGSAGTGGGRPHLAWTADIIRDIAQAEGLSFPMALIDAEQDGEELVEHYRAGRITPLENAPVLTEDTLRGATRIVAQMGAEPFIAALERGAQVIIAGRASDAAIFAAIPLMRGAGAGPAWHAAKILECGAAAVARRLHPDCMVADIDTAGFTVAPPNPLLACTPQSVAAHTLYENADPFLITEPSGRLDTTSSTYTAVDDRTVRVEGSRFATRDQYDVRLEGVALRGHRYLVIGGVRDPLVVRRIDEYLADALASVRRKVSESLGIESEQYQVVSRIYGRDGCLGALEPERDHVGHEVGLNLEFIAADRESAQAIASLAWHTVLHHPIPEWSGLLSNVALPYSPPEVDGGRVYEFVLNHVLRLDDPLDPFTTTLEQVG